MEVKVSVIIPAYNSEQTIKRSVLSVLEQDEKDLEVVIVNDGSTDKTAEICEELAQQDTRVKVFMQENQGVSAARNRGLKEAVGEYIAWVDSDDQMKPQFCTKMISAIETNKCDMVICGYESDRGGEIKTICPDMWKEKHSYDISECFSGIVTNTLSHPLWNKLFVRKNIQIEFDKELTMGEDIDFTTKYWKCCRRVCFVNDVLYFYNEQNGNSLTKTWKNSITGAVENCILLLNTMSELEIPEHEMDDYFVGYIFGQVRNSQSIKDRELLKKISLLSKIVHDRKVSSLKKVIQKAYIEVKLRIICAQIKR